MQKPVGTLDDDACAHDYYMNVGPSFADPLAGQISAEIASIDLSLT